MSVYIKSLYMTSFGQFENVKLEFAPTFNLIYGKNESGKSTIASFIEGILYGFDDGKRVRHFNKKQEIYKPNQSYRYSGYGIFNKKGTNYRVSRNFFDGTYEIYNLDANEKVSSKASDLNFPGKFLLGIDYDLYKNFINNFQSQEALSIVKEKVLEILTNGSDYYFSSRLAIENLNKKLNDIGSARAYTKPYAKTMEKVDKLESELLSLSDIRKNYKNDLEKLYNNREKLENCKQKLDELKKTRDDYRSNPSYENFEEQIKYQNELKLVENELKKYEEYKDYKVENPNEDKNINWKNVMMCSLTSLFFIILYYKNKLSYFLALAVFLPIIMYFLLDYNKGQNIDKKYNLDENYIIYRGLVKDKQSIEEIIRVLDKKNQDICLEDYLSLKDIDIKDIDSQISKLEGNLIKLNDENLLLEKNLAAVEDKLSKEVDLKDELSFKKQKLEQMEKEIAAINLAIDTIDAINKNDRSNLKIYSDKVSEIISQISRGRYEKIAYDENLKASILRNDGSNLDLDKLSTGFYDQMNFALKFSINEKLLDNFIIFDDAFINYDIDRLRIALFYLLDGADFKQIIYFTCHNREKEILNSEEIDYNIIDLEDI